MGPEIPCSITSGEHSLPRPGVVHHMTLLQTIAAPFRNSRKDRLKKSEMVFFLVFDRKWMSIAEAHDLISLAGEKGLIGLEDGMFRPLFDPADVHLPLGFRPSSTVLVREDPIQDVIDRIATASGRNREEITAEVNRLIDTGYDGKLLMPAAVCIVARRYGVPVEDKISSLLGMIDES